METNANDYQSQQPLQNTQPQALTQSETPNVSQTESLTILHLPQDAISHTQPPALQYTSKYFMHRLLNQQSIQHTELSPISHTPQ